MAILILGIYMGLVFLGLAGLLGFWMALELGNGIE